MTIISLPIPRSASTVLVFPGQGSQWTGMAAELLDNSATFADRLRECAAAVAVYTDWDVEDVILQRPGAPGLDRVEVVQPALWAVHVSLAALWMANGVTPHAVMGQSQGEVAAACVAGALSLAEGARVISLRSQLFAEKLAGTGGIASVRMAVDELAPLLAPYAGRLAIAGDIGPRTATVAGDEEPLQHLAAQLNSRGIRATTIPASIPSHCFAVEPLRERLTELLAPVSPRPTRFPMYSTVTGAAVDGRALDADYWYANARRPVLFQPAMRRLLAHGARVFVESSAHPVLTSAMADTAERSGVPATVAGTLRRGHGGIDQFHAALAAARRGLVTVVAAA